MASLITVKGLNAGRRYPLERQETLIGRQPDAPVYLESLAVSRHHARVVSDNGAYFVEDMGSSNGTFVNGTRVAGRVLLTERDVLQIGPYELGLLLDPSSGVEAHQINRRLAVAEGAVPMTDLEKARHLFQEAGLAFPTIPVELAAGLKERGKWLFSTRELKMSPYNLQHYLQEGDGTPGEYVVLGHSGHGTNSYAIQYYLVSGPLRLFLHLGWGGVYMDADEAASKIRECFSLADQIVPAAMTLGKLAAGERLTLVGSDFYGSYWSTPGQSRQKERRGSKGPAEVLAEVLHWLKSPPPNEPLQQTGPA